MQLNITTFC